ATAAAASLRDTAWAGALDNPDRIAALRARLTAILGLDDPRDVRPRVILRNAAVIGDATPAGGIAGRGAGFQAYPVSWTVFRNVTGEGLLLVPDRPAVADLVVVPDCEISPEQLSGLAPGLPRSAQVARRCAEAGCRVLVPALISRLAPIGGHPGVRSVKHNPRETLWRAGYELGHTPVTYDLQRILAAADWLQQNRPAGSRRPLAVAGQGEGGRLALHAAAVDPRFAAAWISGAFAPRESLWEEPIDRNLFGLLTTFGDAEVASLVAPRPLFIEAGPYPEVLLTDAHGGAPGRLGTPAPEALSREVARWRRLTAVPEERWIPGAPDRFGQGLSRFLGVLVGTPEAAESESSTEPAPGPAAADPADRMLRSHLQTLEDIQWLMRDGEYARREFWKRADTRDLAAFTNTAAGYRGLFKTNVIGVIPPASLPASPRTRWLGETNGVRRYEVLLDVHPEVFAYGILCVPSDLKPGERRPVVVCQHGLEGRPADISDPTVASPFYHQYGLRLAERGFVTFAPQNPYIGGTRFRQVLRQAQPLGLTLWSFIVRQHEVLTDWLAAQPFVDANRIAFYGLSYGGKTAMRVPVLVDRYCLSICSADYNEWIWKNASSRAPYSYLWTGEYDMPEWNLGNTFNYAEMSWLLLPRPFMVERGHDDGVAPDEWVAYEFAKTRRHYVKLGLGDRTEIEFFDGPHSIHGTGTFDFLHRHLRWPKPPGSGK
ncbi:MAG: hypothetical protein J0L84_09950, partial [Verrucomicrobia bacterium]|nr:hypothetical protein [Verrucomicrobiota bacterium]